MKISDIILLHKVAKVISFVLTYLKVVCSLKKKSYSVQSFFNFFYFLFFFFFLFIFFFFYFGQFYFNVIKICSPAIFKHISCF